MFSKLSILSLYLRFCQCRRLRMVIYTIMWVVAIYSVVSSFSFLYACRPMAKFWDPRIARGSCIRKLAIPVFNGIMNVVTDFFIVIIPIFIFWRVQISTRQRIGLVLMFMTGGFVVVISIIRLKTSIEIMHEIDISWHGAFVIMWCLSYGDTSRRCLGAVLGLQLTRTAPLLPLAPSNSFIQEMLIRCHSGKFHLLVRIISL
ncbi:hypothetical protein MPH_08675 [Macrophomina phaseolina MS6]|uniref:Rhodopsin domain-containing protein n=1 Tax=Macrophomina phaseolina (strain MS6) TaxID=1126212 RepID=K2SB93_MACPH|nr:hypothetical protein MPH_08675 [Macrophomina phaseolina MS6]